MSIFNLLKRVIVFLILNEANKKHKINNKSNDIACEKMYLNILIILKLCTHLKAFLKAETHKKIQNYS